VEFGRNIKTLDLFGSRTRSEAAIERAAVVLGPGSAVSVERAGSQRCYQSGLEARVEANQRIE
jgi:hypothetical protein